MLPLTTSVTALKMIGSAYASRLKKLGIETIGDLLYHIPFRYEDFSLISKISMLQQGEKVTVLGTVVSLKNIYTKHGKKLQKGIIADETGEIEAIWYNQPFLTNILKTDIKVTLAGEVSWFGNHLVFESPDYEIIKPTTSLIHSGRLVPVYPETAGVSSKWLRSRIASILHKFYPAIYEFLPADLVTDFQLLGEKEAIYKIHFPDNLNAAMVAKKRLAFDELVILELSARIRRHEWQKSKASRKFLISPFFAKITDFINRLPFQLTNAQKRACKEILADLSKDTPMNRLLEGDVGSGKTVVAAIAMYVSFLNGYQAVLMAPTEILAQQHYQTIKKLLAQFQIKAGLLTGKTKLKKKNHYDIIIGTHALLYNQKAVGNLGLVIVDEQQRFGVEQRTKLREIGISPHLLSMTATPIPRTIALTLYADLNLSVIDEMPVGRLKVKTWVVPTDKRDSAYNWIRKQIKDSKYKQQVFIVCPLIETSESLTTVKAAKAEYGKLKKEIFTDLNIGLLHGKLKDKEKDKVIKSLQSGKLNILVATPVVEVGLDIPGASIMVIEAADRFGLAQLHQLRGRVGRNNIQSYCLLFTESDNPKVAERLKYLERYYSGPKLAELDLNLRGPGEIYGTRQHGNFGLKIADLSDLTLIEESKKAVKTIITADPSLSRFPLLQERLREVKIQAIAPD